MTSRAADHGDGPRASNQSGIDLGDTHAFVDPNHSGQVVLIATVHGFIVPGEATNLASFDPLVQFTFRIENTGDAKPDKTIAVTFDPRVPEPDGFSQNANIKIDGLRGSFTAAVTQASDDAAPNPRIVTELSNEKNPPTGIQFFAGEADDPSFFDLIGFKRFVAGALAGDAGAAENLQRGRDTFAGYNILALR